jgi:hypothetical protein
VHARISSGGPLNLLHCYHAVTAAPERQPQVLVPSASPLLSRVSSHNNTVLRYGITSATIPPYLIRYHAAGMCVSSTTLHHHPRHQNALLHQAVSADLGRICTFMGTRCCRSAASYTSCQPPNRHKTPTQNLTNRHTDGSPGVQHAVIDRCVCLQGLLSGFCELRILFSGESIHLQHPPPK